MPALGSAAAGHWPGLLEPSAGGGGGSGFSSRERLLNQLQSPPKALSCSVSQPETACPSVLQTRSRLTLLSDSGPPRQLTALFSLSSPCCLAASPAGVPTSPGGFLFLQQELGLSSSPCPLSSRLLNYAANLVHACMLSHFSHV